MNRGIFNWQSLMTWGGFVYFYGLFFAETDKLWGRPSYLWTLWAGMLLFSSGLVILVVLAVTGRLRKGSPAHRAVGASDDSYDGQRRRFGGGDFGSASALAAAGAVGIAGASVNIDGTPMMDGGMVDVMGKAYGDSGSSFSDDFGGGMDSSSIGGSNW